MKVAMNGRRLQVGLLAAVLILANAQCLFACAAEFSADHRPPPCHRQHQPSKPGEAPSSCADAPLVAEYRTANLEARLTWFATSLMDIVPADPVRTEAAVLRNAI